MGGAEGGQERSVALPAKLISVVCIFSATPQYGYTWCCSVLCCFAKKIGLIKLMSQDDICFTPPASPQLWLHLLTRPSFVSSGQSHGSTSLETHFKGHHASAECSRKLSVTFYLKVWLLE